MGGSGSKQNDVENVNANTGTKKGKGKVFELSDEDIEELRLVSKFTRKEIVHLQRRYIELGADVVLEDFNEIPEIKYNPLRGRMISVWRGDAAPGQKIGFRDFVSLLSVFAPNADTEQKIRFLFQLYDISGNSAISKDDLKYILKLIVVNNMTESKLSSVVDETFNEADLDRDGKIGYDEFRKIVLSDGTVQSRVTISF